MAEQQKNPIGNTSRGIVTGSAIKHSAEGTKVITGTDLRTGKGK